MVMGLGTGDWGDDMPFGIDEPIDPDIVYCLKCDEGVKEFFTIFFRDEDGRKRYGSVCPDCRDQEKMNELSEKMNKDS